MKNDAPALICATDRRRARIREQAERWNGLDYLEVSDDQLELTVFFLNRAPAGITQDHVRVDGGQRVTDIQVRAVDVCHQADPRRDDCLRVWVDRGGDYSTYTLCLVEVDDAGQPVYEDDGQGGRRYRPMPGIDSRYACLPFSFKAGCPTDLDCRAQPACLPPARAEPELSYLAKDYASFRQLILDRLALVMPGWQERHVPDLGIALAEVLAYAGDALSYYQDAVASEAYLRTARQRISVRRHARLVDYALHEGCNARTFVCVETEADLRLEADDVFFVTGYNDALRVGKPVLSRDDLRVLSPGAYEVFEPVWRDPGTSIELHAAHSTIQLYTWGNEKCCLPRGTMSATLVDEYAPVPEPPPPAQKGQGRGRKKPPPPPPVERRRKLALKVGDVLILEERLGPVTGAEADADPRHRHAVRLTRVEPGLDVLCDQPIVSVSWAEEDALPFPLCLSAIGRPPDCTLLTGVSVAHGNAILVDHGRWVVEDDPDAERWVVPPPSAEWRCEGQKNPVPAGEAPARFRPVLSKGPLTFRQAIAGAGPAAALLRQDPRRAVPHIALGSIVPAPDGLGPVYRPTALANLDNLATNLRLFALPPQETGGQEGVAAASSPVAPETPAGEAGQGYSRAANPGLATLPVRPAETSVAERQISLLGFLLQLLSPATRKLLAEKETTDLLLDSLEADLVHLQSPWQARRDLLASGPDDRHYVAEMDDAGRAHLRFGDGELGRRPEPGAGFVVAYRVGNGQAGNVGAGAIQHAGFRRTLHIDGIRGVRNPLPAQGGVDPEPLEQVKLLAPFALRTDLQRAITPADYAALVMHGFGGKVQRAHATQRWTGSWYEVLVAVDPLAGARADPALFQAIEHYLEPYRRIGHDVVVRPALYVPLHVGLRVCIRPDFVAGHVKAALLDRLSNRRLRDNSLGFFHPDNLTFGEGILLSKLVALAHSVAGVENAVVTRLQRYGRPPQNELEEGILRLAPYEVARLDNDPGNLENGLLELEIGGGR